MNQKKIATFGKHMICPEIKDGDLSAQGLKDFENYKYRFLSSNYTGKSVYNNDILMEHLVKAVDNTCDKSKTPLLLMSDGKDSLALAVALSKLGKEVYSLTLLKNSDKEMKEYLVNVSHQLGLNSHFITVDEILSTFDVDLFKKSFKAMKDPVMDQGYFFFLFGLKLFFERNDHIDSSQFEVIDGLGNDEYLGYMMSMQQWRAFKLSRLGLWKLLPKTLKSLKWYFRSPAESHGDLSTLACFFNFPASYDLNRYFSKIPKSKKREEYLDFRAFSRGNFHDHQCMMGKTDTASRYWGSRCVFPYLDTKLTEYCFNIPINEKLDFDNIVNKIPLRKFLVEHVNWNQTKRGVDLFLDLDLEKFYTDVVFKIVPADLIDIIKHNLILNSSVKKRAYLELMNFYTYCSINEGLSDQEIRSILNG